MSQRQVAMEASASRQPKSKGWLSRFFRHLYPYRPRFHERHFWVIFGLIVLIVFVHSAGESTGILGSLGLPSFAPVSLYLAPVVYAALTFGFAGAMATAICAVILSIPNFLFWHSGPQRLGEMFQIAIVVVVAFLVGRQVSRAKYALRQEEAAVTALNTSNIRYRSLLNSSPNAILVINPSGTILEANPAAKTLFGRGNATLEMKTIADLVGIAGAKRLLSSYQNSRKLGHLVIKQSGGPELYLEPIFAAADDSKGNVVIQVLLRDVTEEHHRQAGLRAYAAHVMQAQEEERQLIARELHDEIIQSLVLLCRRLGMAESGTESLPEALAASLNEARKDTEEIVSRLRNFAKTLRPPILDDLGVVTSIRRLLTDFADRTKVEGKLRIAGEDQRLASDVELALFRITQEALWNVEHHARATQVVVTITFDENFVRLNVVDNGMGFSMPSNSSDFLASGHLGLISMQERAELIGGELKIHSNPGRGASVTASIPVTSKQPDSL